LLDQRGGDCAAEARGWIGSAARGAPIAFAPTELPVYTFATSAEQLNQQAFLVALRVGGKARRDGDASAHSSGTLLGQAAITLDGLMPRVSFPFRITLLRHGLEVGILSGVLQVCDAHGRPIHAGE
jgi:hypothetical protein